MEHLVQWSLALFHLVAMQSNALRKYVNSDESAETHKSASRSACADNLQLLHLVFLQQPNWDGCKSNPIDKILSELWCEVKLQPHAGIIATELWWFQQIEAEPKPWTGTKNNADFWHKFTCLISKTGTLPNLAEINCSLGLWFVMNLRRIL